MNKLGLLCQVFLVPLATEMALGQGNFFNLDFELATVPNVPPDQPIFINASAGVPGWTVYIGTNPSAQVLYNGISGGGALVSLIDPHTANYGNRVISGNFTATLDSGVVFIGGTPIPVAAALAETGLIPATGHSLLFDASGDVSALLVTFNGQNLPFARVGTGSNYQIYGADISSIAGQTGELRFTERPITPPTYPIAFLDSIRFSSGSIPEPSTGALVVLGGMVVGSRKLRCKV